MITRQQQVLELVHLNGVLRPKDLAKRGIGSRYLSTLVREGMLRRTGRGLYVLPTHIPSQHHSLAEAARRVPNGIVCLLSALRYHELTTQAPFEVWMAIPEKAWQPRVDHPPIRTVRVSGKALEFGVQQHDVERVSVRIYSPAKTVADCFKFRNRIGLDVALEALRDARAKRVVTIDELWRAAEATRMQNVMRP
ncbi:MAG TPA: type IV toxin-antitoxin system AbiEi family antitoxin domain-containing protein [Longimicrobium sp.]